MVGGRWLEAAQQLLQRHNITKEDFCTIIYTTFREEESTEISLFMATQIAANRLS